VNNATLGCVADCYPSEITPKAVAGVVAGMLDGFVEENNLKEIEKCYNGGSTIETAIAAALADVKK